MQRKIHKIDASGKILGRLATEINVLLRGKGKASYQPHIDDGDIVEVSNVAELKFTGNKLNQKFYYHYSGYQGGMSSELLKKKMRENPEFVLRKAVFNMLPKNRTRKEIIRRLKFIK